MELKRFGIAAAGSTAAGLNRTFYGIETPSAGLRSLARDVLIVPFMELKLFIFLVRLINDAVLIVPFMELKHGKIHRRRQNPPVLIVPFMELKRRRQCFFVVASMS